MLKQLVTTLFRDAARAAPAALAPAMQVDASMRARPLLVQLFSPGLRALGMPTGRSLGTSAPLLGMSGYHIYYQKHRKEVEKELEAELSRKPTPQEVPKEVARRWKLLSGEEKQEYENQLPEGERDVKKTKTTASNLSGYNLYTRERMGGKKFGKGLGPEAGNSGLREVAADWKTLPEDVKEEYNARAREMREEAEREHARAQKLLREQAKKSKS